MYDVKTYYDVIDDLIAINTFSKGRFLLCYL